MQKWEYLALNLSDVTKSERRETQGILVPVIVAHRYEVLITRLPGPQQDPERQSVWGPEEINETTSAEGAADIQTRWRNAGGQQVARLGNEGWELVTVLFMEDQVSKSISKELWFKRPSQQPK